jgi:hypothetical protein
LFVKPFLKKRKEIYSSIKSNRFHLRLFKVLWFVAACCRGKRQKIKLDKHGAIENDKKSAKRLQSRKRCAILFIGILTAIAYIVGS